MKREVGAPMSDRAGMLGDVLVAIAAAILLWLLLQPLPLRPGAGPYVILGLVLLTTVLLRRRGSGWGDLGLSRGAICGS